MLKLNSYTLTFAFFAVLFLPLFGLSAYVSAFEAQGTGEFNYSDRNSFRPQSTSIVVTGTGDDNYDGSYSFDEAVIDNGQIRYYIYVSDSGGPTGAAVRLQVNAISNGDSGFDGAALTEGSIIRRITGIDSEQYRVGLSNTEIFLEIDQAIKDHLSGDSVYFFQRYRQDGRDRLRINKGNPLGIGYGYSEALHNIREGSPAEVPNSFYFTLESGSGGGMPAIAAPYCEPSDGRLIDRSDGSISSVQIRGLNASGFAGSFESRCEDLDEEPEEDSNRNINVQVRFTDNDLVGSFNDTGRVGPVEVIIYDSDGATIAQNSTNSMPANDSRITLSTSFDDIDPGTYRLCTNAYTNVFDTCREATKLAGETLRVEFSGEAAHESFFTDPETEGDDPTTCEDSGGFAWAFCAALRLFSSGLDFIDRSLEGWLRMERDRFDRGELRDAWAVIRNIAYMLLVPVMLVMIIGTALGFEFVSAYTVKKALPRMVVATIFIALSYPLAVLFVDAVQAIGDGIHNILLLPFRDILEWTELTRETRLSDIAVRPTNGASGAAAGTALSAGMLALVGVAAASVWGGGLVATVAGFIGVALLILLAVFALLLARQTLVIALILFSPIALIAWIFPGRTTLFTLWSKTFWLMMWFYPVIMITTAVGKILAALVASGG